MFSNNSKVLLRVCCPVDAYELVDFGEERKARLKQLRDRAIAENRWEYAEPIVFDPLDDVFLAYWLEKTKHPIVKPLVGCDYLEEHFKKFRESEFILNGGSESELEISAVGDLMCTPGLEQSCNELYSETANLIFDADVSFANLESTFSEGDIIPMTFGSEDSPKINLNESQYFTLTSHLGKKYSIVQLSNNHILDCGENGALRTIKHLAEDKISYVGVNIDESASEKAVITEHNGIKIGWVAHTFSVNGNSLPDGKPWFVNMTNFHTCTNPDMSRILSQIAYCKSEHCDIIVASMHWGLEFELYPHPEQREWSQTMANAGADIIIGHHPHMVQFSEILHPSNMPEKDVPVIYSLGNLTPVFSFPETVLSNVARISIAQKNDKYMISGIKLFPVAILRECCDGNSVLKLKKVKDLLKMHIDGEMHEYVKRIASIADMVLGENWRQ